MDVLESHAFQGRLVVQAPTVKQGLALAVRGPVAGVLPIELHQQDQLVLPLGFEPRTARL